METEDTEKTEAAEKGPKKLGSILDRFLTPSGPAISNTVGNTASNSSATSDASEEAKVVTARGTEDGLVLRIDGKATWEAIIGELEQFLGSRRRFLEGGEVSIEWLERLPTPEQSFELEQYLRENFGVEVVSRRRRPAFTTIVDRSASRSRSKVVGSVSPKGPLSGRELSSIEQAAAGEALLNSRLEMDHYNEPENAEERVSEASSSARDAHAKDERVERVLRDTIEILEDPSGPSYLRRVSKLLGDDLVYEEDANAKIVFGTFRSGQRLETPYSLIVVGDVNPGADLIAGGDIFVLGSLRGTAHAAAYDDEAHDRVIVALQMQPVQLRIGSILSRGGDEASRGTEIARIENRRIVVESFNPRAQIRRRTS